jgi:hypothetical protein
VDHTGTPPAVAWPSAFMPIDRIDPPGNSSIEELASGLFEFVGETHSTSESDGWNPSERSQLFRHNLHYLEWAWTLTQDRKSGRAAFADLWNSWRAGTRFGKWDEWSPYVVALRSWVMATDKVRSMILDNAAIALPAGLRAAAFAADITTAPVRVLHANVADVDEARKATANLEQSNTRRVVYLGRLMPHKGIDTILDMASTLNDYGVVLDVACRTARGSSAAASHMSTTRPFCTASLRIGARRCSRHTCSSSVEADSPMCWGSGSLEARRFRISAGVGASWCNRVENLVVPEQGDGDVRASGQEGRPQERRNWGR